MPQDHLKKMCKHVKGYFGIGFNIDPLPPIYNAKRIGFLLFILAFLQLAQAASSYKIFRQDFIWTFFIYKIIEILVNCLLFIGFHLKHSTILCLWMFLTRFLTLFSFGLIVYFVVVIDRLSSEQGYING